MNPATVLASSPSWVQQPPPTHTHPLCGELWVSQLVYTMAWRCPGDKPLFEPMMIHFRCASSARLKWVPLSWSIFTVDKLTPNKSIMLLNAHQSNIRYLSSNRYFHLCINFLTTIYRFVSTHFCMIKFLNIHRFGRCVISLDGVDSWAVPPSIHL